MKPTASPTKSRDISLIEVYRADEVFCTGTMGELAPVVELDGRILGAGTIGSMTQQLSDYYAELTATMGVAVV